MYVFFDTFDGHLLCLCSFSVSCKFWIHSTACHGTHQLRPTSKNGPKVRARRQNRHANRPTIRSKLEWICNRCAAACFTSYQSCRKCCARDGTEEVVPGLDMTTGKCQPVAHVKANGPAGLEAAQPKKPSQQEQARTALQSENAQDYFKGDHWSGTGGGKASCAERRSPPDRSPDRCCESKVGKSSQGGRSTEETMAHVRGARQREPTGEHRCTSDTAGAHVQDKRWSWKTGGEYNHRETALEQILELIEPTWPAGQAAPRANEMVHQARSVLVRSRSRSKLHSKKRDMNAHAVTGDWYQPEKM